MMKAYIYTNSKQVFLEFDSNPVSTSLSPLVGWDIYMGQSPEPGGGEYVVEVDGIYSLASVVKRGSPTTPPKSCCSCSCPCKGE